MASDCREEKKLKILKQTELAGYETFFFSFLFNIKWPLKKINL